MKALSLHQPYADWIAYGKKTIETRRWNTSYRGDVVICSTAKPDNSDHHRRGVAICIVRIKSTRPMTIDDIGAACCNTYPGAFAFDLTDLRQLMPFNVKGKQRWFDIPDDLVNSHLLKSPAEGSAE